MELEIPVESSASVKAAGLDLKKVSRTIEIKMAPLDFMPHAVHTFLTQVDRKVWDGTHFELHGGHVLQAHRAIESHQPEGSDSNGSNGAEFGTSVLFREFSKKFPHVKYTLAYNGGSMGSAMYINVDDNHEHHRSLHGSDGRDIPETGEPCFGYISVGRDVVDMMDALEVNANNFLVNPVTIKKTSIKR